MRRIYLDLCCFKRPFDDQSQERVRREAAAVASVIARAERGELALVRSPALRLENERNPREDRRLAAALWLDGAAVDVALDDPAEKRAAALVEMGFPVFDAFHVAFAEAAGAEWLLTCDDQLLQLGSRHGASLRVAVANPTAFPAEAP